MIVTGLARITSKLGNKKKDGVVINWHGEYNGKAEFGKEDKEFHVEHVF